MTQYQQQLVYRNDFTHLARFNRSVAVDVIHLERPLQFLFWFTSRRDVDRQKKLLEVDLAAVVGVERAEHVGTELVSVALREEAGIDLMSSSSSSSSSCMVVVINTFIVLNSVLRCRQFYL